MELASKYEPQAVESKWYAAWLKQRVFESKPNPSKEPYTILIPPPNVTGVLHMGHMLNNTIQDVLIRKARMQGKEALWVPGTDHASIATEAKVVKLLKEEFQTTKTQIGRPKFLEHAWAWKNKYGDVILEQLKKLGASCDWSRTRFTMEPALSKGVIETFIRLHAKGYIYRTHRMVNWDPQGKTVVSDDEVIHRERQDGLYYINYKLENDLGFITIATTRPETIFADTAIAVHPDDQRYKHLVRKQAYIPLLDKAIPIIADDYIKMDFGTGALKVTPAHDINDYNLGQKHKLDVIDILDEDGKLNAKAQFFVGEDRFIARKKVVQQLQKIGQLAKVEQLKHNIGFSERTDAVIEPRLSKQWFVKMDELVKPALRAVETGTIRFYPDKVKNSYFQWMQNIRDWCISRQLWWGHQIPVYYLPDGNYVVAKNRAEALTQAQKIDQNLTDNDLIQDPDVLDTWFSSGLWPMAVFDGILEPDNPAIKYYYPTNDIVTAPEILFFWIARMIIFGYEYRGEAPFKKVYFTGIVRDKQRRKMSKQLGNSPDPLKLIKVYGADGVRVGMLFSSPAGNDLLFDEKLCEQGRNFANKIWNALRLIKNWEVVDSEETTNELLLARAACQWFDNKLKVTLIKIDKLYAEYRLSDVLLEIYRLVWEDFCSWLLEIIKPQKGKSIAAETHTQIIYFLEILLKILHPFMPFITEEIWQLIRRRPANTFLTTSNYPTLPKTYEKEVLTNYEKAFALISFIRNIRNKHQISSKKTLEVSFKTSEIDVYKSSELLICKLANLEKLNFTAQKPANTTRFVFGKDELFLSLASPTQDIAELSKTLAHTKKFLAQIEQKLNNPEFLEHAPAQVIAREKQKAADARRKIQTLENQITSGS